MTMKYSAVIFDLFGTIVEDITGPPYDQAITGMASILSVDAGDFNQLWFSTLYERSTGRFVTLEDNIKYICEKLGISCTDGEIRDAAIIRYDLAKQSMMVPRSNSLYTLSQLRERNYKIGLISDCSPSEPLIWPNTPLAPLFDIAVFSCYVNLKKPDPNIYEFAANKLGIECNNCLYVGNGGSNELNGAYEATMYPVLILPEDAPKEYLLPSNEVKEFAQIHGRIISSLEEVLSLV